MLTNTVMDTARDRVGVEPVANGVEMAGPTDVVAANTSLFDRDEVQARRMRRQRRQERAARRNGGGWTVRMW